MDLGPRLCFITEQSTILQRYEFCFVQRVSIPVLTANTVFANICLSSSICLPGFASCYFYPSISDISSSFFWLTDIKSFVAYFSVCCKNRLNSQFCLQSHRVRRYKVYDRFYFYFFIFFFMTGSLLRVKCRRLNEGSFDERRIL